MVDFKAVGRSGGKVLGSGLIVVAGPPGVGKSTLLAQEENAIFFSCDKGLGFLDVRTVECSDWGELKRASMELSEQAGDLGYEPVMVIDTGDAARDLLVDFIRGDKTRVTLEDYGQALGVWKKWLRWLADLPFLAVVLCHSEVVEERAGVVGASVMLALSGSSARALASTADVLLLAEFGKAGRDGRRERFLCLDVAGDGKDRTGLFPGRMALDWGEVKKFLGKGENQ